MKVGKKMSELKGNKVKVSNVANLVLTVTHPPLAPPPNVIDNAGPQSKPVEKLDVKKPKAKKSTGKAYCYVVYIQGRRTRK